MWEVSWLCVQTENLGLVLKDTMRRWGSPKWKSFGYCFILIERKVARSKNKVGLMTYNPALGSFLRKEKAWLSLTLKYSCLFIGFNLFPKELYLKKWPHTQCTFPVTISRSNTVTLKEDNLLGQKFKWGQEDRERRQVLGWPNLMLYEEDFFQFISH